MRRSDPAASNPFPRRRARAPSRARRLPHILAVVLAVSAVAAVRPNRYGHSDREERHLFPAVSAGPLDPAWSPDGRWIAFSMRGDIWKVPAEGGEAVALTAGPAYHFEPAWSPDGRRIALTRDIGGNLEIGIVDAEGGDVTPVAPDDDVDLEPAWSADGKSLYFASARARGWRIFRHDLADGRTTEVVEGIQPAVSPDGSALVYVDDGIRILDLASGESRLVRDEESEYRMHPAWTSDGQRLLYVTEDLGSNDVRLIAARGGRPVELTIDRAHHEMAPSPAPDGTRFAFVAFNAALPTLYTADLAGGQPGAWREVPITALRPRTATGRVRVRVVDAEGTPVPARVFVDAGDGRSYVPDGAFHRAAMLFDRHYFHMRGEAEITVPAGRTRIEALRGWEYRPSAASVDVRAGDTETVTLRLERLMDLPAAGWYSGDTHAHDLHQGFGLTHEAFFLQLEAEDLHVTNALIHMDGTRLMGRWSDLTGAPHPLSTPTHMLQYAQEFRGGLGHVGMIGTHSFILPFIAGQNGTPYAQHTLENRYFEEAKAQGGLGGFMHPYLNPPRTPEAAASTLIAVDAALGLGDFYDMAALYSDELGSAEFYYHLLNAGFRIPATGGTDNFSDVWRDPPPGSSRTFAYVDGPLSVRAWLDAVRRGRTFLSTGPLLRFEVDGRIAGDSIRLPATGAAGVRVTAEARSIARLDSLQILVNGRVVRTVPARDSLHIAFEGDVPVPDGGWIAARALGPASPWFGDDYAFAHTGPVYVTRGDRRFVDAGDVRFLARTVDAIRPRVERSTWRTPAERAAFLAALDAAAAVYARLEAAASN